MAFSKRQLSHRKLKHLDVKFSTCGDLFEGYTSVTLGNLRRNISQFLSTCAHLDLRQVALTKNTRSFSKISKLILALFDIYSNNTALEQGQLVSGSGIKIMKRFLGLLSVCLILAACSAEEELDLNDVPIRGLKTMLVSVDEPTIVRRYPSVLEPSELSTIGFEMGGRVGEIDLKVGQIVAKDQLLAELDQEAVEIQIASAESSVAQARVAAENSAANLARQEQLLKSGTVTQAAVDNAKTDATSTAQTLVQAERALDSARETAGNTSLVAPFDGIISSVDAQSFTTVSAGTPIVTLYPAAGFKVTFTVNYEIANQLAVGKNATLRLADAPDQTLTGVVTELGSRADAVSSFPVVVSIDDAPENIKSGMAVEVNLEFDLPARTGFTIPITAAVIEGSSENVPNAQEPRPIQMFVYEPDSQTVSKREVLVAGVSENSVLVVSGLEAGERVAIAGVSFLTDGQSVVLLED